MEHEQETAHKPQTTDGKSSTQEVVPGAEIVRASTPRPLTFAPSMAEKSANGTEEQDPTITSFPHRAPSAPPLPEDDDVLLTERIVTQSPLPGQAAPFPPEQSEFIWLFEYGLEMDNTLLNSVERLDGLALPYGTAHLKGYRVIFGAIELGTNQMTATLATLMPSSKSETETWGVLYRIPRRITEATEGEGSLLDTVHGALPPRPLFRAVIIEVHDTQRHRTLQAITYILTDMAQVNFYPLSTKQRAYDNFVQRILHIGRKQHLPERYLKQWSESRPTMRQGNTPLAPTPTNNEQDTEPLPAMMELALSGPVPSIAPSSMRLSSTRLLSRWLMIFACYLAVILLGTLVLILLQSIGLLDLTGMSNNTTLNVPGIVLVYGMLGGCISSIVTLGRFHAVQTPGFVLMTWFTRPYIGAVLALFAYLLLTSGLFIFGSNVQQHQALYLLAGILAGLCEGWLFLRR